MKSDPSCLSENATLCLREVVSGKETAFWGDSALEAFTVIRKVLFELFVWLLGQFWRHRKNWLGRGELFAIFSFSLSWRYLNDNASYSHLKLFTFFFSFFKFPWWDLGPKRGRERVIQKPGLRTGRYKSIAGVHYPGNVFYKLTCNSLTSWVAW